MSLARLFLPLFALLIPILSGQTITAPTIASVTQSQTVTQFQSITLSVSANGSTPFTYQWYKDGVAISGATTNLLPFASLATTDEGSYTVVVTNSAGSATGGPILLAVRPATPPSISSNPYATAAVTGTSFSLSVSAYGTTPLTYTWSRGTTVVATTTDSNSNYNTFTVATAAPSDAGSYTVTVTNAVGSATSAAATVTVTSPIAPSITSQPTGGAVEIGASFSFWPSISGTAPFTYQWYKDGTAIAGATSNYYSDYSYSTSDAGSYTLVVTNSVGSVTSSAAVISTKAATAPSINSNPSSTSTTVGSYFSLSVYASGSSPLSYQWKKDGVNITGATSSSYSVSNASTSDAGSYTVTVSNSAGTATSTAATVSIANALSPVITSAPASATLELGGSIYLDVGASGTQPITYQWKKDGVNIAGATYGSFSKYNTSSTDAGSYTVVVTNSQGSVTSPAAAITIRAASAPVITRHPANVAGIIGSSVYLTASATGTPQPTFQWYKDGTVIPNATSSSFSINSLTSSDLGSYHVVATNSAGTATSSAASISAASITAPIITSSPASASILPGGYLSLYANCEGSSVTAQWYKDGAPIGSPSTYGSTNYYISNAQPSNAGTYKVVFTNSAGSVTSDEGIITVDAVSTRPQITGISGSIHYYAGSYTSVSCTARDTDATFQWYKDGTAIVGATSASHYFNLSSSTAGIYTVRVTSQGASSTSSGISVTLHAPEITPVFTLNPASATTTAGSYFYFSAQATGYPTPTLQWKKDGVAVTGATSSYFERSSATSSDAGTYTVTATNTHGSATSASATLTLAPSDYYISQQPRSLTVSSNYYGSLGVGVGGYPFAPSTATYQWKKDGQSIAGATNSYYYFPSPVTSAVAGVYSVVITIGSTTLTSSDAVVSFSSQATGPSISTQPLAQSIVRGNPVTLQVVATGTGALAYQWRKNGAAISGATGATYTIPAVSNDDAGTYSVVVTDTVATISSSAVTLTILPATAPTITTQPTARVAQAGDSVTFTIAATGAPAPTYQWTKDGTPIAGATAASLSLANVQASDSGNYAATATNIAGAATSNVANLAVYTTPLAAPSITTQPVSVACLAGGTATFTVTVTGNPTPTLRWYHGNDPVNGATTDTLVINNVSSADAGDYSVVATNSQGTAISTRATLSLGHPAAGTYSGDLGSGGAWMMNIGQDGVATFVAYLAGSGRAIVQTSFVVNLDGTFRVGSENNAAGTSTDFYYHGVVSGSISGNTLTGQFPGLAVTFTGTKATATSAQAVSGYYTAVTIAAETSTSHLLSGSDGSVYVVMVGAGGVSSARGTVDASGAFSATSSTGTLTGTLNAASDSLRGSFTPAAGSPVVVGTPSSNTNTDQLFAISTRGVAGAESKTMIAGLVVSGSTSKEVLIRAIGPTLGTFGVPGTLANPKLRLFKGDTAFLENDDWGLSGQADAIAAAASRAGAFALPSGSKDAAVITRLEPGNYTAHITTEGGTAGVSLIEVYDLSPGQTNGARMVGLSTRGEVGKDADVLIVGVYVTGSAPKKVLLRAVGPTLASFGVSGTLADPKLELYKGDQLLRANDNWSDGADAGLLAEAFSATGAFQLTSGSKDAALLLYLEPGAYTAKAVGVGGTTGVAIIEVYEVP